MSRSLPSHNLLKFTAIPLALGILSACGGGGGGGIGIADGGIRGTGSSVGPVSGFGSVFVNGVKFETRNIPNRSVDSNDDISSEDKLEKGMILRVEGVWRPDNTGEAERLEYDDTFRGPISDVVLPDAANNTPGSFRLLGQNIRFDNRTVVRVGNGELTDGMTVRVSAWRTGDGYRASYVGSVTTGPDFPLELEGQIEEVNQEGFRIGDQWIQGRFTAGYPGNLTINDVLVGALVEVEGRFLSPGRDIIAAEIRFADDRRFRGDEDEDIELSGPVQSLNLSGSTFLLNGVPVDFDSKTEFDDFSRSRIADGLLVQVEGEFRSGRVYAEEIELLEGNAEVEAAVQSADPSANELIVGGVTVRITNNTLIDSDDDITNNVFDADFLEVEGIERRDENDQVFLEALNIEIESAEDEFSLKGRLETGNYPLVTGTVKVLGVSLLYDEGAYTEVENDDDEDWRDCSVVSIDYEQSGNQFRALGIECEDDD
ncbi:DUF5666 domain-containing protein [Marinobacter sp. MBR-105]